MERLDWLLSDRSRPDRWPGRLYEEGATACAVAKGCAAWEASVVRPASGSTKERLMSRKVSLELRLGLEVGLGYFGKPVEETGGVSRYVAESGTVLVRLPNDDVGLRGMGSARAWDICEGAMRNVGTPLTVDGGSVGP